MRLILRSARHHLHDIAAYGLTQQRGASGYVLDLLADRCGTEPADWDVPVEISLDFQTFRAHIQHLSLYAQRSLACPLKWHLKEPDYLNGSFFSVVTFVASSVTQQRHHFHLCHQHLVSGLGIDHFSASRASP